MSDSTFLVVLVALPFVGSLAAALFRTNARNAEAWLAGAVALTALAIAAASDSCYAFAAGRAGRMLSAGRIRLLSRISGSFLIGGGLWLALSKAR